MGANYVDYNLPAMSGKELMAKFIALQEQDRYDNGHSYSGGIGMARGLKVIDQTFASEQEAHSFVIGRAQKWEEAIAVRVGDGWYIGAWCAS